MATRSWESVELTRLHEGQHFLPGHRFFRALGFGHGCRRRGPLRTAASRQRRCGGRGHVGQGPARSSADIASSPITSGLSRGATRSWRGRRGTNPRSHRAGSRRRHVVVAFQWLKGGRSGSGRGRRLGRRGLTGTGLVSRAWSGSHGPATRPRGRPAMRGMSRKGTAGGSRSGKAAGARQGGRRRRRRRGRTWPTGWYWRSGSRSRRGVRRNGSGRCRGR
jgi:hypothetical protein